jgi:hypothetical protein
MPLSGTGHGEHFGFGDGGTVAGRVAAGQRPWPPGGTAGSGGEPGAAASTISTFRLPSADC